MSDNVVSADSAPEGSGVAELNQENLDPILATEDSIESPVEELTEAVKDAAKNGATKEEIKELIEEYELKVNGKTKKIKINLNDKKDMIRRLQMAEAGQSAMQEKAALEKMLTEELTKAKKDPWSFMKDQLGLDPDELAEMRIQQRIEEMKKSPEQVERERIQKELEGARKKLQEIEHEKENEKMMRLQEKAATHLDQEINSALQNDPELPKTRKTVKRIADAMLWAMDNGYPDITVPDVLPAVKSEIMSEFNEFVAALPDEMMEKYIGKNIFEKMRKKRLAQAKTTQSIPNIAVKAVATPKTDGKQSEKKDARDFFRKLGME